MIASTFVPSPTQFHSAYAHSATRHTCAHSDDDTRPARLALPYRPAPLLIPRLNEESGGREAVNSPEREQWAVESYDMRPPRLWRR